MIPVYVPYIDKYKRSAHEAISSNWISNYGIYVNNSEHMFKTILNVKHCILMNSGTAATHCLLLALKNKHPDIAKIYVPNNVFIAPWNCVLSVYGTSCVEVMRTNPETMNIDTSEEYINALDTNSAVFVVHNLGNIVNVPRLKRLRPDIVFVEDNCEGIFGRYEGTYSGTSPSSLCSAISLYANKTLTTGEGGAFFTNDDDTYRYVRSVYSHGMTNQRYIHDKLAYNYRMTNIEAAFLYDQLNDLDHILTSKQQLFANYDRLLQNKLDEGKFAKIKSEVNTTPANWMYCIILPNVGFKQIETYMDERMVQIRPFFYDIRKHEHLKDIQVSDQEIATNGIMLPSYPGLTEKQQEYIVNCLNDWIN